MLLGLCLIAASVPAQAEVVALADNGFVVRHAVTVAADPDSAYQMVRMPDQWWSKDHSWTGNAANFYMDAQAGGCFCELIPEQGEGPERRLRGSVQHMRILYADRGKILRLSGALGPLQSEALTGTLTILFTPQDGGTQISFEYVVGGYARFGMADVAPAVDGVLGQQLARLAELLGTPGDPATAPADEPPAETPEE